MKFVVFSIDVISLLKTRMLINTGLHWQGNITVAHIVLWREAEYEYDIYVVNRKLPKNSTKMREASFLR